MIDEIEKKIRNNSLKSLINEASQLREKHFRNTVELCSILNAKSGRCSENCKYCTQSIHYKTRSLIYPLIHPDKIFENALNAFKSGINYFSIVTSGEKLQGKGFNTVCTAVKKIKDNLDIKICASLGTLTLNELEELKNAGLTRYHHNLETSENFYPNICTTHNWNDRYSTVLAAKKAGLEVCSGGLFGLGESWKDRINLALTIKKLNVNSVPINFLSPIAGTPLGQQNLLSSEEALRIIILYRLTIPDKTIRICGGRAAVLKEKQIELFSAGANAIMTGNYLTTSGVNHKADKNMIKKAGLKNKK
jgi:biotin synthase